jgi:hypothetical protein
MCKEVYTDFLILVLPWYPYTLIKICRRVPKQYFNFSVDVIIKIITVFEITESLNFWCRFEHLDVSFKVSSMTMKIYSQEMIKRCIWASWKYSYAFYNKSCKKASEHKDTLNILGKYCIEKFWNAIYRLQKRENSQILS